MAMVRLCRGTAEDGLVSELGLCSIRRRIIGYSKPSHHVCALQGRLAVDCPGIDNRLHAGCRLQYGVEELQRCCRVVLRLWTATVRLGKS